MAISKAPSGPIILRGSLSQAGLVVDSPDEDHFLLIDSGNDDRLLLDSTNIDTFLLE